MLRNGLPYYKTNKDWYYTKEIEKFRWKDYLTDLGKSIPEVVKSYEDYQNEINNAVSDPYYVYIRLQEIEKEMRSDYEKQGLSPEEIEKKIEEWRNN